MARIIESENGNRRIIKMSTDDILSIVKDYQRIVPRFSKIEDARNYLSDVVIYVPEDVYNNLVESMLNEQIHQAMQNVCYNLNTMHSRAGQDDLAVVYRNIYYDYRGNSVEV